ncbi:hypothetical protein GS447_03880 [Rhodococcus hoagii]|nr:hypothetical protein [Prescottella equi]
MLGLTTDKVYRCCKSHAPGPVKRNGIARMKENKFLRTQLLADMDEMANNDDAD